MNENVFNYKQRVIVKHSEEKTVISYEYIEGEIEPSLARRALIGVDEVVDVCAFVISKDFSVDVVAFRHVTLGVDSPFDHFFCVRARGLHFDVVGGRCDWSVAVLSSGDFVVYRNELSPIEKFLDALSNRSAELVLRSAEALKVINSSSSP